MHRRKRSPHFPGVRGSFDCVKRSCTTCIRLLIQCWWVHQACEGLQSQVERQRHKIAGLELELRKQTLIADERGREATEAERLSEELDRTRAKLKSTYIA